MVDKVNFSGCLMLKIVLTLVLLFMLGCGVAENKAPVVKDKPLYTLMYVKVDKAPFIKSEQIKVFNIVDGIATTSKGQISSEYLEDKRSEYRLYVNSPNADKIRILNIKPKYKDGIWLKAGKYHIEISAKKYTTCIREPTSCRSGDMNGNLRKASLQRLLLTSKKRSAL